MTVILATWEKEGGAQSEAAWAKKRDPIKDKPKQKGLRVWFKW
jgi:hypothetical protein